MTTKRRSPHGALLAGLAALTLATAGRAAAAAGDPGADFAAAEAAAFTAADADGSGTLSPDEFASFHELVRAQLEALRFTRLDTNGDGALTAIEIAAGRPAHGPRGFGPGR